MKNKDFIEKWKQVKGYEGLYEISNKGNIKSFGKGGINQFKNKIRILKPQLTGKYLSVTLTKNRKSKIYMVAKMVAEHFILKIKNKDFINHKDGNKLNNKVDNLEWCTRSENQIHAYKKNLQPLPIGEKNPRAKLSNKDIFEIRKLLLDNNYTQKEVGLMFGVSRTTISSIKNNYNWSKI